MNLRVPIVIALLASLSALVTAATAEAQGMLGTKHNLSVTGPGPIKAQTETEVCVFCHTPHNASPRAPLWNRQLSGQTYTMYTGNTLQATPALAPNGYSRLCLSCHDGSLAIGAVMNLRAQPATIAMTGTAANGTLPPTSTALIGTDLTNDHPISFAFNSTVYSNDQELVNPTGLTTGPIRLYEGATAGLRDSVQCTTCHDPHSVVHPFFLKKSFTGRNDNLCLTCHVKPGWAGSSHESATTKLFNGTAVSELSCGACHRPHTETGSPRLLRGAIGGTGLAIEQTCYRCHNATGITFNLQAEFAKKTATSGSIHPIDAASGHLPVFTVANPPEGALNTLDKHVECSDCHNPHRVRARETPGTGGVYEGMRGIRLDGTVRNDATVSGSDNLIQYEICFRCHGDSRSIAVPDNVDGDQNGTRSAGAIPTSNKRVEFQTTNSSYHPVAGAGKNTSSRLASQLLGGLTTTSTIKCTDCHNNDAYGTLQGPVPTSASLPSQPKGPHGSTNFNLLRARVWNVPLGPSAFNTANFQLCFRCHSSSLLVTTQDCDVAGTNFCDDNSAGRGKDNLHKIHLETRAGKARGVCKSCHYNVHSNVEASNTQYRILNNASLNDPRGDYCGTNGTPITNPNLVPLTTTRLINFHPSITATGGRAKPEWCFNKVTRKRECFLQCHTADGLMRGNAGGHEYIPNATGDVQ